MRFKTQVPKRTAGASVGCIRLSPCTDQEFWVACIGMGGGSHAFMASILAGLVLVACTPIRGSNRHNSRVKDAGTDEGGVQVGDASVADRSTVAGEATAAPGEPCGTAGERICATSQIPLACERGKWTYTVPCDSGERCETEAGANQGNCLRSDLTCIDRKPNEEFCDGDLVRACSSGGPRVVRTCPDFQRCAPVNGRPRCICAVGTVDRGRGCEEATDCQIDRGGCDTLTMCSVVGGTRICSECPPGYSGNGIDGCTPLLSALTVTPGVLQPAFSPTVNSYKVRLGLLQSTVALLPRAPTGVQIDVNGAALAPDAQWSSAVLPLGEQTFLLTLTAESGSHTRYEIKLERGGVQEAYVKASRPDADDGFGGSIALSGDTLVVGALNEDSSSGGVGGDENDNGAADSGAVYVFVRKGNVWSQQAYLKAESPASGDYFGTSVAISGDTIAVGATRAMTWGTISASPPGVVFVFTRNASGVWTQQTRLQSPARDADLFGFSVAVQRDRLVVGAPYDAESVGLSGALYVYERNNADNTWSEPLKLKAKEPVAQGVLGWVVALDGDTILGGAPGDSQLVPGEGGQGSAAVFVRRDPSWVMQQLLVPPQRVDGDIFGYGVAIAGDLAVVGAPESAELRSAPDGHAYVFERTADRWNMSASLQAATPRDGDAFGTGVAVSRDVLVISASGDASAGNGFAGDPTKSGPNGAGAVYLYGRQDANWVRSAFVKVNMPDANDYFAQRLAIDVDTLVAGAVWEAGGSMGVNGDESSNRLSKSGSAYVFR